MIDRTPQTLVLLDAGLRSVARPLDPDVLSRELVAVAPAVNVRSVKQLTRAGGIEPSLLEKTVERVVLGLCAGDPPLAEIQTQIRKAGIDPLGIELVDLESPTRHVSSTDLARDKAIILLAASVARARSFVGSRPEHTRPRVSTTMSRRALFSLTPPVYQSVPAVAPTRCAADIGCRACADACPADALSWTDGQIYYDKEKCQRCGICITVCPRGAVINPAITPAQLAAQITTLLDPAIGTLQPRGILFVCDRSRGSADSCPDGWLPVYLPCVGMAPPTWLLAPLLLGAAAVAVLPCGDQCPMAKHDVIQARVAYCHRFLELVDASQDLVRLHASAQPLRVRNVARVSIESPFNHTGPGRVLRQLADQHNASQDLCLDDPQSPLGIVEIRDEACTGCGTCAESCPTGALAFEQEHDSVALSFDAQLCSACGQCPPRCPEAAGQALRLSRRTDLQLLDQGRAVLYENQTVRCVSCGATVGSAAMLERIEALLGEHHLDTMPLLSRYCSDCRRWPITKVDWTRKMKEIER